ATRIAVLVGLNDAENVGVIARAAHALDIDALVLDPSCTDSYSRRTVRVSMGEILHLPVARAVTWPNDLDVLHAAGFETWAMTPASDAMDLWSVSPEQLPKRLAIVVGAEGPGLDGRTMAATTRRVRIPINSKVDSLNVGHAAAITFAAISRP
ncbi:MAG: tRNA G18 (ribose-2'-O)-methylase SpoU, partial [Ilumatobacter sp.]